MPNRISKHKVFISFHSDDIHYKDALVRYCNENDIIVDGSVRDGDISDDLNDEQTRIKIRDEGLRDATVTVLLVGQNTKNRKHVDWELHASMIDTVRNPKSGILVVHLPTVGAQSTRVANDADMSVLRPLSLSWQPAPTDRTTLVTMYRFLPERIIDQLCNGVPISIVNFEDIYSSYSDINKILRLKSLIDNAFNVRNSNRYDTSRPLRRNNSSLTITF